MNPLLPMNRMLCCIGASFDLAAAVTVRTQPVGQSCRVADGSGTLDAEGTTIDSVAVTCAFSTSLRGTVSGLNPGVAVTLTDGTHPLVVAADGPFAFPDILDDGTRCEVSVQTQPAGASCIVRNGSGRFVAAGFQDISVLCS